MILGEIAQAPFSNQWSNTEENIAFGVYTIIASRILKMLYAL